MMGLTQCTGKFQEIPQIYGEAHMFRLFREIQIPNYRTKQFAMQGSMGSLHFYSREIPQNYHTFALFGPPKIHNFMTSDNWWKVCMKTLKQINVSFSERCLDSFQETPYPRMKS